MPKDPLTLRLPSSAIEMIDDLIGSVYGTNRAEVARTLVLDHLKHLAAQNLVVLKLAKDDD